MTDKTQPIKFPIDPKKMYVTKWSGFEMYISGRDFLDKIFDYDFKLTAEIVPETQPRDWSDVVEDILLQAWKFKNATYPKTLSQSSCFKEEVLAILQEFDAQNQANASDNGASGECVSDKIDHLIEAIAEILTGVDENGEPFVTQENMLLRFRRLTRYMEKNYREQWNKYTSKKTAPTAELLGQVSTILGQAEPTEEPLECTKRYSVPLAIGEIYDVAGNGCFVDQAKLLSIAAESDHFIVQGVVLPVTYKVHRDRILSKHTPKPVEREISFWVNVYKIAKGKIVTEYYEDIAEAHRNNVEERIACLHFKRTFKEGEGL